MARNAETTVAGAPIYPRIYRGWVIGAVSAGWSAEVLKASNYLHSKVCPPRIRHHGYT